MNKKQKKSKMNFKIIFMNTIYYIIFMICMFQTFDFIDTNIPVLDIIDPIFENIIFFVISIYLGLISASIIHEFGHLVFGLLSGYSFVSYRIGNLLWKKENGKLKLKKFSLAGTGGQCIMSPPNMKNDDYPIVLYNLGGSFLNFIVGFIILIIYYFSEETLILDYILSTIGSYNILVGVINLVPTKSKLINNDGYNAYELSINKEGKHALWVNLKAEEFISKGTNLKDIPAEYFIMPSDESMKNSFVATLGYMCCTYMFECKQEDEAIIAMKHILNIDSGLVGIHKGLLTCIIMIYELTNNNIDEATSLLTNEQKSFMKSMKDFPTVLITEYAYALIVDKNRKKADKFKARYEKIVKNYPNPSELSNDTELFEELDTIYKNSYLENENK